MIYFTFQIFINFSIEDILIYDKQFIKHLSLLFENIQNQLYDFILINCSIHSTYIIENI